MFGATKGCRHEGCGGVFELALDGTETTLYGFRNPAEGRNPAAPLLLDRKGDLYGTAEDIKNMTCMTLGPILFSQIDKSSLMTDAHSGYVHYGKKFARNEMVDHGAEYVRGDAYTNTVERFFSIFKCGMTGIYQHCSERHLRRYLAEFDFRYSSRIALGVY